MPSGRLLENGIMALNLTEFHMAKYTGCFIFDLNPTRSKLVVVCGSLINLYVEMEGILELSLCCSSLEYVHALICPLLLCVHVSLELKGILCLNDICTRESVKIIQKI